MSKNRFKFTLTVFVGLILITISIISALASLVNALESTDDDFEDEAFNVEDLI